MLPATVELTQGHTIGIPGHYLRLKDTEILRDYEKVLDRITIDEKHRLKKQIEQQDFKHSEEWQALKKEMSELKQLLYPIYPGVPKDKKTHAIWWKYYKAERIEQGDERYRDLPDEPPRLHDDDAG